MPMSAIRAPPQQGSDLVMVAEEGNKKLTATVLKNEPQSSIAAAFEKLSAQLANAKTAMHVRLPETLYQIAKGEKTFHSLALR